jgi:hypothetical protein
VIAENNESMMTRIDPLYNIIFDENSDQFGRVGFGGMPQPAVVEDLEPEYVPSETPSGMENILGAGIFG